MLKSAIYKKSVANDTGNYQQVLQFDNCLVDLSNKKIIIKNSDNDILLNSNLTVLEKNFHTISYKGFFENGSRFRLIKPIDSSIVESIKQEYNCEKAFTIGSISPNGFAVHFILYTNDQSPNIPKVVTSGADEQIQRLIDGIQMALQFGLKSNAFDYSKRILQLISNTNDLKRFNGANEIIRFYNVNKNNYSFEEQKKIKT